MLFLSLWGPDPASRYSSELREVSCTPEASGGPTCWTPPTRWCLTLKYHPSQPEWCLLTCVPEENTVTREQPVFGGTNTSRLAEIKVRGIRSRNYPRELLGVMVHQTPPTLFLDVCALSVRIQRHWFNDHWFKMYIACPKTARCLHAGSLACLQKTPCFLRWAASGWHGIW